MAVSTARNRVIEGDDIEAQIAALPELTYLTRTNPDNPSIWETYNPISGEIVDTGIFAGGGDRGLLAAAAPVIGLAASTVGLPFISGMLGSATGLTGSALSGLTGATIGGGTTAIAGGTTEDILKGALLAGGASYGSSLIDNYLSTGSITDPGITERQLAIADAKQLANQGLSQSQIADVLDSSGYAEAIVNRAVASVTTPTTNVSIPTSTATDVVNVTGTAAPAINTGGLLSSLVTTPSAVSTPVTDAGTVKVTDKATPQQVDQAVVNLINSQLSANTNTPANLANVQVTDQRPTTTTQDVIDAITASLPSVTNPTVNTVTTPEVTVTGTSTPKVSDVLTPVTTVTPTVTTPAATTTTTTKTNEIGLTDEQMVNLLKAGLGLFGTLGATSALTNRGTTNPVGLPTQMPPMYTDDYFTKVQQNYNQLLPAVPRDVASPLRDWYLSQYGA